jgi:hypothetical protein
MKPRSCVLWFSLLVFVLAAVGTVAFYIRQFVLTFWLTMALLVAYPCVFAIFVPLLTGDGRLAVKKILLLTASITIVAIAVTNSVWVVITPKWSFSVTTDKSSYEVGENVKITVSLKNVGFITHSFESALRDPVMVSVEYQPTENPTSTIQVWYSPYHWENTQFSLAPSYSLERHFIWNQTNTANPWFSNASYMPGTYQLVAFIPDAEAEILIYYGAHTLFISRAGFNVS